MVERSQEAPARSSDQAVTERDEKQNAGAAEPQGARRPYQRPSVQKRRSVRQATLVSGTGSSGVGSSAAP